MKNKRWTEQEDLILKNNIDKSIKELSLIIGRTISSIKNRKKTLGITEENLWTEEELRIIIKCYSNSSSKELLNLLEKRSWSSILAKAKTLNLKRAEYQYSTMRKSNVDVLLNDSVQTYYYIGLLFADGYFTNKKLQLNQCMKNKNMVYKFAEYIGTENIKVYDENKPVEILGKKTMKHGQILCYVKDSKIIPMIKDKYDIQYEIHKKSKTYNPPSLSVFKNISDDLFLSFLIGFIDGDGSIYKSKNNGRSIVITSHKNWNAILEYWVYRLQKIFKVKLNKKIISEYKSCVRMRWHNSFVIDGLINFIYKNNLYICKSKWNKILIE